MKVLDKIMKDVVSGNMDHALERALKIEQFGSISSLEANMEYEKDGSLPRNVKAGVEGTSRPACGRNPRRRDMILTGQAFNVRARRMNFMDNYGSTKS